MLSIIIMYMHGQEPVTVELGSCIEPTFTGPKRRLQNRADTFQYVPLLQGLRALLQNKDIFDEVIL